MSNFDVWQPEGGAVVKAWTKGVEFDDNAQKQVQNMALMPFVYPHVAIMPDVHLGIGATVGSVVPTKGAIIPAAVGVDIGCGMMAMRTFLTASDLPDNLAKLRADIERAVPHGRTDNGGSKDRGAWHNLPSNVEQTAAHLIQDPAVEVLNKHSISVKRAANHLGTLGTGNHFIEICVDEEQRVWIMLHSGSRGVGNKIGTTFIEIAKKDMERWFINLPSKDLAYLPEGTEHFEDYWQAVGWAQKYARVNRELMMAAVFDQFAFHFPVEKLVRRNGDLSAYMEMTVNCHHNYVNREQHGGKSVLVTRKGAVRARIGDMGIIPGSMGAKSYIVRGLGNADSLHSCSHGAGRRMSRTQAKKQYTVEDHVIATRGVECRKDAEVVDETPMAYKSIDAVMEAQRDLVEVVHTLKQVLCVKG